MKFIPKRNSVIKDSAGALKVVYRYCKKPFFLRIVQMLIMSVKPALSVLVLEKLIDNTQLLIRNEENRVVLWMSLLVLLLLLYSIAVSMENYISILLEKKVNETFSEHILKKYLTIPYQCFETPEIQDIINKVGSQPQNVFMTLFFNVTNIISMVFSIISLVFVFFRVSLWLSLIFLIVIVVMVFGNIKATEYLNCMYLDQTQEERKMGYLYSLLSEKHSVLELRIFDAFSYIKEKWNKINTRILKERIQKTVYSEKYKIVSNLGLCGWIVGLMGILIYSLYRNQISVGMFTSVLTSATSVVSMSKVFAESVADVSRKHLNIFCYEQFMELPEKEYGEETVHEKEKHFIEFKNVSFSYPCKDEEIIHNLSLSFYTDEHIAIVGKNGAGKSTIIKLLVGLYKPSNGTIMLDGKDIQSYSKDELRKVIGVVFQDYKEYELTVRENIAFGDIGNINSDQRIRETLELGMISELGDKLDQPLGRIEQEGQDLSGGQWQRLAIARACFSSAEFVVLDEPTAALDPIAESEVYKNFLNVKGMKGCLIISHRLASAKISDRIIVMDKGMKVEEGNHEQLMGKLGVYYNMFSAQKEWYKNND